MMCHKPVKGLHYRAEVSVSRSVCTDAKLLMISGMKVTSGTACSFQDRNPQSVIETIQKKNKIHP